MTVDGDRSATHVETFDDVVRDLQELRERAGSISYAEIAGRIATQREERGVASAAARIARTTVYDAFRSGRARIDARLVGEIATALGADDDEAEQWMTRCRRAKRHDAGEPAATEAPGVAHVETTEPEPEPAPVELVQPTAIPDIASPGFAALLMIWAVGINFAGHAITPMLDLPIFLDMTGTAFAAILLGPWRGAAVAVASNLTFVAVSGGDIMAFSIVNVIGALVWGYGVHRFGMGASLPRFLTLGVLVGVVCAIAALPIMMLVYGAHAGHAVDDLTAHFLGLGGPMVVAVLSSSLITSIIDKVLSGFFALALLTMFRSYVRVPIAPGLIARPPQHPRTPAAG